MTTPITPSLRRRGYSVTAGAALAVLGLASCVGGGPAGEEPVIPGSGAGSSADTEPLTPTDPTELIGLWRVSDAEGEGAGTYLRIDANEIMVLRECGADFASWRAADGLLLIGEINSFVGDCHGDAGATLPLDLPWLSNAAIATTTDDGWWLRDADGAVLVRLSADGEPAEIPDLSPELLSAPEVTDEIREAFAPSEPLSEEFTAPTREELLGSWVPVEEADTTPYVEFADTGDWNGSDGCNGAQGQWTSNDSGTLLTTSGPMTQIGCEGANVPQDLWLTRTAGLDAEGQLHLFDIDGEHLLTLERGDAPASA